MSEVDFEGLMTCFMRVSVFAAVYYVGFIVGRMTNKD